MGAAQTAVSEMQVRAWSSYTRMVIHLLPFLKSDFWKDIYVYNLVPSESLLSSHIFKKEACTSNAHQERSR